MKIIVTIWTVMIVSMYVTSSYADEKMSPDNIAAEGKMLQSGKIDRNWISWSEDNSNDRKESDTLPVLDANAQNNERRIYVDESRKSNWIEWSENRKNEAERHINVNAQSTNRIDSDIQEKTVIVKDGLYIEWHRNGRKKIEGNYKDGKKEGKWIQWDANGRKISEEQYVKGNLKGQS
ncbi:MAG: hypothetical protein EP297_04635 [Gammaproteobacteria bacterium]|nr:MAG: hypothetical protein EP297_04635 [Gammaproteobacteria bacterium]